MSSTTHAHSHAKHNGSHTESLRGELAGLQEVIGEGVQEASASGKRVLRAAGMAATEAAGGVRDAAYHLRDRSRQTIVQRPLTSVGIALGAGALAMGLFMLMRGRR